MSTAETIQGTQLSKGGNYSQKYGICFILLVTLNCGGSTSENCTYFDSSTTVANGACKAEVCKCSTDIWCATSISFSILRIVKFHVVSEWNFGTFNFPKIKIKI